MENPAVFRAELPDDELDVLSRERLSWPGISTRTSAWCWRSGPKACWPTTRPGGGLTDVDFPGSGSAKQAALLLLDELSVALQPSAGIAVVIGGQRAAGRSCAAWPRVGSVLGELADPLPRRLEGRRTTESPDILRSEVVELLVRAAPGPPTDDGLAVFPFAARYQPQVITRPATSAPDRGDDR